MHFVAVGWEGSACYKFRKLGSVSLGIHDAFDAQGFRFSFAFICLPSAEHPTFTMPQVPEQQWLEQTTDAQEVRFVRLKER